MVQDSLDEIDETITVTLSGESNATVADATGIITITDDDGTPTLSISPLTTVETGTLSATVSLSGASSEDVTVNYATSNGTANAGNDYTSTTGTLTIAAGDTSGTIDISILADSVSEEDETFNVTLTSPSSNASLATSSATMTITDDDTAPTISIADLTASEADGTVNLTATLSEASERIITVNFATANDSAEATSDYVTGTGVITFTPGEDLTESVPVTLIADSTDEPDETLKVTLSGAQNATISDANAVLTITDNNNPVTISIDDLVTSNEAALSHDVTVRLSAVSGKDVSVNYSTADGDGANKATFNNDYNTTSSTITFAAGEVTATIPVTVLADSQNEGDEVFYINLSGASNATISDSQSSITITDDDGEPTISVQDATTTDESGTAITTP